MKFQGHQIRKRYFLIILIVICTTIGTIYPLFAREIDDYRAIINGSTIGFLGSLFIYFSEMHIFDPKKRKLSFIPILIVKTLSYFVGFFIIILSVKGIIDSLFYNIPFMDYVTGEQFQDFIIREDFNIILIYTLAFLLVVNFTLQMTRKIGHDMMINYITGRYHHPKNEDMIIMFIDVKSSTTIAEKIGDLKFHNFLNDFYFDITRCILSTKGEIYRYVGDEINITWPLKRGLKNANCITTYFYVLHQIKRQKEKYLNKYGLIPQFTAGLHCGNVTTGEIGEVKSQVIHHGEVIHSTNLIKSEFKKLNYNFLITETLLQKINLPGAINAIKCGKIHRPDTDGTINLFTLNEGK
jgi:adenylate cyclase